MKQPSCLSSYHIRYVPHAPLIAGAAYTMNIDKAGEKKNDQKKQWMSFVVNTAAGRLLIISDSVV